ncbi:MAG TPA: ABC transporter permease [Candidatus Thermoplasmatota archaeon]|nr:ABC transporter permease [Candidatus Thermoplasmatota archaeon]
MMARDILRLSLLSLTARKLRSWLTILGIVVGVVSVVTLLALSAGVQSSISGQLGGLGANTITVSPGFNRAADGPGGFGPGGGVRVEESTNSDPLTTSDLRIVSGTPGVQYVNGIISGQATVAYRDEEATITVQGVDASVWSKMATVTLGSGRLLQTGDTTVALLGSRVATQVFGTELTVNQVITIEGQSVRVIGVLASTGSFGQQDGSIIMSRETVASILDEPTNEFSSIAVTAASGYDAESVADNITTRLQLSRHVTDDTQDFTVSASASFQNQVSSISDTLAIFLGAVAAVALLVGAIGIANTMFMAVMERAKQIGIMKALGTNNHEIRAMFMLESGLMGFFGGVIGVCLGVLLAYALGNSNLPSIFPGGPRGGGNSGLNLVITPSIIQYSILFATGIGAVAGLLPAIHAARLQPVDSLRSE